MEEEIKHAGFMHEEEGGDPATTGPCHYRLCQAVLRVNLNITIGSDHTIMHLLHCDSLIYHVSP